MNVEIIEVTLVVVVTEAKFSTKASRRRQQLTHAPARRWNAVEATFQKKPQIEEAAHGIARNAYIRHVAVEAIHQKSTEDRLRLTKEMLLCRRT
jgi:hypothetical protein